MKFTETGIPGAFVVDINRIVDERGFFARQWCRNEFENNRLNPDLVQVNMAFNRKMGTVRGMHYQVKPYEEAKLVRCTRGGIFDVVVDLRPTSPTFRKWHGVELSADTHRMLYVPEGCAHGYQVLEDDTEIQYQTSAFYAPDAAFGVPFDDPGLRIEWPLPVTLVSDADRSWPRLGAIQSTKTNE